MTVNLIWRALAAQKATAWPLGLWRGLTGMAFRRAVVLVCLLGAACSSKECALYDADEECEPSRLCRGEVVPQFFYDENHCGDGAQCAVCPDPLLANATAACLNRRSCGFACKSLFGDCNGNPADGCETPLAADPNNCGGCGVHCRHECVGGTCALRWEGEIGVVALTDGVEQSGIRPRPFRTIWLASDGGVLDVREGPLDGGDAFTLASVPAAKGVTPAAMQADETLFFTDGAAGDGGVFRLALNASGAAVEKIASGQDGPAALQITSEGVYWTNYLGGQLMRVPLDGGVAQVLASGLVHPRRLASDDERLFWIDEGTDGDGAVMAMPLGGGAAVTVAAGGAPESITIMMQPDATGRLTVQLPVWADRAARQVFVSTGGTPLALLSPSAAPIDWNPTQMFPSGESFYVFDAAHPSVYGGALFIIGDPEFQPPFGLPVSRPSPASAIAVSTPSRVYWTDGSIIDSGPGP